MAKVKTGELIGPALDWAVAKAQGRTPTLNMNSHGRVWHGWWLATGGEYERMPNYSNDWAQAGPILERERIAIGYGHYVWNAAKYGLGWYIGGPTPLVAAMRCYAASKLGDTVEVPDELL